jgi:cytochrome c oxidase subunit I+III
VLASMAYAHVHLAMLLDVCPPPGAALPTAGHGTANALLLLAGSGLLAWSARAPLREGARSQWALRLRVGLALACACGAFAMAWRGHALAGLAPQADGWSASVAALLAYQGFHLVVLGVLAAYLIARSWSGLLGPRARATLDNVALFWHVATVQGLVSEAVPRITPWLG